MENPPVLELQQVSKVYEGATPFRALDNIDLVVEKGEFISIVGKSGSGKSTLLNLLGCLDMPSGGRIFINQKPVSGMSSDQLADLRRDEIGFVFQSFNLAPTLSALGNVTLPMMIRRMKKEEREQIAMQNLEAMGLSSKAESMPSQLSGGEKQRVAIARAISNDPNILLADEPTGNLDSKSSRSIMDILERLCRARQMTVILVTHDQSLAEEADRIVRIADGRIESDISKKHTKQRRN